MKKRDLPVRWIIGGTLALLGVGLLWHNAATAGDEEKHFRRRQDALNALRSLQHQAQQDEAGLQCYRAFPVKTRQPIESLRNDLEKQGAAQWSRLGTEPVAELWIRESLRITISNIDFRNLSVFLNNAAALRPPWILEGLDLVSAEDPGTGDATLTMESIYEKP